MNYTMTKTGLNSVEFKTDKGVTIKMNFNTNDNYEVEDNVTSNLLMSYEERIKKSINDFM